MYRPNRINASLPAAWRFGAIAILWAFATGVLTGTLLPASWLPVSRLPAIWHDPSGVAVPIGTPASRPHPPTAWTRAGRADVRQPVTVIRTIDGDTFEAEAHLWPGLEMATRVRLRGIDAAEIKASCPDERARAEAAAEALHALLAQGGVTIFNIGPDKYAGRVVASVATRRTPDVSAALLAGGYARRYEGGRRRGWCGGG